MNSMVSVGKCKECSSPFALTSTARTLDVARGLSEPERCPKCRKVNAEAIRSRGAAYWAAPVEMDDAKRCWGKYGLAKLVREHPVRDQLPDCSVPPDLPLLYSKDPAAVERRVAAGEFTAEDLWVARKFAAISGAADQLVKNLEDPNGTRVSVLVGPTGTGKSTWVPYAILRSKLGQQGRICVTQPRLITLRKAKDAADDSTTPGFIARHFVRARLPVGMVGVGAGQEIGFQHGGEYEQHDRYTKLLFVTDGTLINWLKNGRIGQFDVVMIDEAHEQSANMELIFALLKYRLSLYPRMRVVIASATIDINKFRTYFGNGRADSVFLADPSGVGNTTQHPIQDRWLEEWRPLVPGFPDLAGSPEPRDRIKLLPQAVSTVVRSISKQHGFAKLGKRRGDILAFAPTIASVELIREAVEQMQRRDRLELDVFVCHAQMSQKELRAFKNSEAVAERAASRGQPTSPQRVIVATNYAETSVTLSNLRYVIDSGLILEPGWDSKSCSYSYDSRWHSQAGCTQRKGRVGRVQPGECFRLYTLAEFSALQPQTPPEITRQPLDSFLLSAKAAGIEDLASFEWLGRKSGDDAGREQNEFEFGRSQQAVKRRGAFDEEGDITGRGLELGGMQVGRVELAECLSFADSFACGLEVATFLAFVSQARSPFRRGQDGMLAYGRWRAGCYDDLEFYLRIYQHWSKQVRDLTSQQLNAWAEGEGINSDSLDNVSSRRKDLMRQFSRRAHTDPTERELDLHRLHRVRLVLARCLFEWVYVRAEDKPQVYGPLSSECPCSATVEIDRESACVGMELDAFVCVERTLARGERLFARHIIRVNKEWLPHLKTAGPISLALMLNRTMHAEGSRVAHSAEIVTRAADLDVSGYAAGQLRDQLRVIRFQDREENADGDDKNDNGLLLAEDVTTGQPVLVRIGTRDRVESGTNLRAYIREVSANPCRLVADQERLLGWYRQNASKPHDALPGRVTSIMRSHATGEVTALFLRIEPGISGRLDRQDMDYSSQVALTSLPLGAFVSVNVKEVKNDREIHFISASAFLSRMQGVSVGEECEAVFIVAVEREVVVEIKPGLRGLLSFKDMGSAMCRNAVQWKPGTTRIRVVVRTARAANNLDPSRWPDVATSEVVEARALTIRGGDEFRDATVINFRQSLDGQRDGIWVEFRPGCEGFLHVSTLARQREIRQARLDDLSEGETLDVVVERIRNDDKIDLRPLYPVAEDIEEGDEFRGYVQGFLPSGDAAFVELVPGTNGFLHRDRFGDENEFDGLTVGTPLDVTVHSIREDGKINLDLI